MHVVDPLDNLALVFTGAQFVPGFDAANHQDFSIQLDFADDFGAELAVAGINAARFQRAPEGAGQSPAGCCDHIVQSRRMRRKRLRRDLVVLCDLGVNAENHRLFFSRKIRKTHGTALSLNSYPRAVDDPV